MNSNAVRDIRAALERVREAVVLTMNTLLEPYTKMLEKAPGAAIGSPRAIRFYEWESHLGRTAERVFDAGGFAAPLRDVEQWERILDQLVTDYRDGGYSVTTAKEWTEMLEPIRHQALAAIDAALKETGEYEKLEFGRGATKAKTGLEKDVLSPKDLVEDLGIGVAAVRKRIRQGHLGPWSREGQRWMILRKDFEAWLSDAAVKLEEGTSKADAERRADILRLLEGRKRRRGGGWKKKEPS